MMLYGKGKQVTILIISLLVASVLNGQAGKIYKYHFNGNLQKGTLISNDESFVVNYSVSELDIEGLTNESGDFYKITIPGHNTSSESGKPEVPVLSRLISIPENSNIKIIISDILTEKVVPYKNSFKGMLYPRQPGTTKNTQIQKPVFVMDKATYAKRGILSSDTVKVESIGKVRNRQLANLLIFPVRYNPSSNEMDVITSMRIEVIFSSGKGSLLSAAPSGSLLFNQSVSNALLNYNSSDLVTGYSDQPVKMIIVTDPAFRKNLQPYLKWKTQKGYKLKTIYKGTNLNTFAQLKDSISKIYKSGTASDPAPEYLLIIGDVNRIPKADGTSQVSDMYYGEFNGNGDYIPDMFIGRLPVADTNELKTVIGKIIQYEKFQFADTNKFYNRALITAGVQSDKDLYMNGQVKYGLTNYLNTANKIDEFHFYDPKSGNALDSIKKLFKKGLSFINYTGHGDASGWISPALRSSDIGLLQNKNMYPFVISNACSTAQFDAPGSFGNTMMVTANKGAVGYIGCTNNSYWDEDYFWAVGVGAISGDPKYTDTGLGALDRLFHTHGELPSDWYLSMGQVNYAGNLAVSESTSSYKKYYWETYSLLGDPSTIPFIGTPDTYQISIPDTLPNGIKSLSMTIPPFSYMAVSHFDTLWDASYASPSGSVVLNMPGLSNDSCLIVISGQNKIPIIKTVRFAEVVNKEYINLTSTAINDISGNNNGVADYGESLFMKLSIDNLGQLGTTGLYAKLSTTSNLVTINNDSVWIGTLTGKSQIVLPTCFGLTISNPVPDRGFITFTLKLADSRAVKNYTFDVGVHAPVLELGTCLIDDSGTGNSNMIAEPGETFNLMFKISNYGTSNITGTLKILNQPSQVTISNPASSTGPILSGSYTLVPVSVKLATNSPHGGSFDIIAQLDCSPYFKTRLFTVPIGKTRESFEYQKLTIFPWINSSSYPWIITGIQAVEGQYSARSGAIPNLSESMLKMKINVPAADTVRFSVRVSSELNYDFLNFRLNGTQMFKISGETDWTEMKFGLKEGFNLLEWFYRKDESVSAGADCAWLDNIIFPTSAFNNKDLKTRKIVTPQIGKSYNQEQISAEVINLGTDTLKSFNLAYQVNTNTPVTQNFIKKINPADTMVVSFNQTANLFGNGTYVLKVFGLNNDDYFLKNDTAQITLLNTGIFDVPGKTDNKIKISPNPFKQAFKLDFESVINEDITISIFGESGKLLWEEKSSIVPGTNSITVYPYGLLPGLYNLRLSGKSTLKAIRIIKIE
jgi:hypothetical protein